MATFDPTVQPMQAPDWTNVTKPIEQPKADTSTGQLIATAGQGLTDVTKIADTAVKEDIKNKVDTGVDKLRDATTDQLIQLRNTQIATSQGAAANGASLLPDAGTPAPANLQAGLDRINTLGVAMAQNNGKSNDTLYTGALAAQAKQLRSQYPGYRDYIDEQIKSISGMDPANAYMKNLTEDINRSAENNKTQTNAVLTTLRDAAASGFHDAGTKEAPDGVSAAQVYSLVKSGQIDPDKGLAWYNSAMRLTYDTKAKADARTSRLGDDADEEKNTQKSFGGTITDTINHNWTTMTIGKGTDTMQGINNFLQTHAGKGDVNDETATAMGQQMQAMRTRTAQQLLAQAADGGDSSVIARMGGDATKVKALIDARLAPMDLAIQDVFNKDWGSAYSHMNFNKAIGADTGYTFNNAPDEAVRNYVRGSQWISQNAGSEFAKEFQKQMLLGPVPASEKAWYQSVRTDLLTQPGQAQGKLTSIQGVIQAGKAAGITSPKTYDELTHSVDDLANPNLSTAAKLNLAKSFFDPTANAGLLSDKNFTMDHYDPVLHRNVPGKLSFFTRLTSSDIAGSIKELGKSDPNVVTNYQTMLSREFGEQLYNKELNNISLTNQNSTVNSTFKLKFTNDSNSSPHFEPVGIKREPLTMTEAKNRGAPVESLNRLNTGMAGLYTAMKGSGNPDPTNAVMKVMQIYNYQPAQEGKDPYRGDIAPILRGDQGPRIPAILTAIQESIKAAQQNYLKEKGAN